MKVNIERSAMSLNDYKFIKTLGKPEIGHLARVQTHLGKYWVKVVPSSSYYLDCEVYEIHEATGEFVDSKVAMTYDDALVKRVLELSQVKEEKGT